MIWNRSLPAQEIQQLYFTNLRKYDTDKWNLYVNQSYNSSLGLSNGTYTYQAFAADSNNNWNQTEERTITIGAAADTTPPNINFTNPTPANDTTQSTTWVEINVSITNASDLDEIKYNEKLLVLISEWGLEHATRTQMESICQPVTSYFDDNSLIQNVIENLQQSLSRIVLLPADIGLTVGAKTGKVYFPNGKIVNSDKIKFKADREGIKYYT